MCSRLIVVVVMVSLILVGCVNEKASPAARPDVLRVVTTTGMIADAAKHIGGEHVAVEALMGPGVDPHLYKATGSDVQKLSDADLILYGGLDLEGRMEEIFEKLSAKKPTIATTKDIPSDRLLIVDAATGKHDPHVWFDVDLWKIVCQTIAEAMIAAKPDRAAAFKANLTTFLSKLDSLDAIAQSEINSIPKNRRVLITAHDAFQYFGKRYGIEVKGIQGTSTAAEASARDIVALADDIAKRRIPAIFVESSVPKATIEALQKAVNSRGWNVKIGPPLFSDAMGSEGTPEGTYDGMVRHNVTAIVTALK